MSYFVYILQSLEDGSYYVGSTQDLTPRIERHNQSRSKYTKAKRPWDLVYCEEHIDKASAMKREREIKDKKSRDYIDKLVRTSRRGDGVVHASTIEDSSRIAWVPFVCRKFCRQPSGAEAILKNHFPPMVKWNIRQRCAAGQTFFFLPRLVLTSSSR